MSQETIQENLDEQLHHGKSSVNSENAQQSTKRALSNVKGDITAIKKKQFEKKVNYLVHCRCKNPRSFSDSYLEKFMSDEYDFHVDRLHYSVCNKLEMIADAIQENKHEDAAFIASLYEDNGLEEEELAHASQLLLVDYLHNPPGFTDFYFELFVHADDPYDIEQLREACYALSNTIADRITEKYLD